MWKAFNGKSMPQDVHLRPTKFFNLIIFPRLIDGHHIDA
uniref:Uncharacterized protein n=1 Tax=Rhizophora mucronata TaxID=61149 RepID=A0A2P2JVY2_RHIMU